MNVRYSSVEEVLMAYEGYEIERTSHNDGDTVEQPDRSVVEKLIEEASSFINTFLTPVYEIPLNPVPPVIKHYTQLFTYRLLKMRKGNNLATDVYDAYIKAVEHLREIRDGRYKLFSLEKEKTSVVSNKNSAPLYPRSKLRDL